MLMAFKSRRPEAWEAAFFSGLEAKDPWFLLGAEIRNIPRDMSCVYIYIYIILGGHWIINIDIDLQI